MTHNIIKTENYLLVVDDSEIKAVDWFINLISKELLKCFKNSAVKSLGGKTINMTEKWLNNNDCKKIIAHLPLNNSPVLEFVPLLPPLEDEVKYNFAEMFYGILKTTYPEFDEWVEAKEYNKAKEKYKYTEDDLMEAMLQISEYYADNLDKDMDGHKKSLDIIQSLQQPKMPVGFECDMENKIAIDGHTVIGSEPKTTTNPQGQTVLVGKYIY